MWQQRQAEPLTDAADAIVEAQESESSYCGARDEHGCEVDGIEGPNRVAGKRLPRSVHDFRPNAEDVPVRRGSGQMGAAVRDLRFGEFTKGRHPMEDPVAFDEREVRREHESRSPPTSCARRHRAVRPATTRARRLTLRRGSPVAAFVLQQLSRRPLSPTCAGKGGVHAAVGRSPNNQELAPSEGEQAGRNRPIGRAMPRRCELGHHLAAIGHQHAFAGPDLPNVFAQAVLELTYTNSLHARKCSSVWPHCQRLGPAVHAPTRVLDNASRPTVAITRRRRETHASLPGQGAVLPLHFGWLGSGQSRAMTRDFFSVSVRAQVTRARI